MYSIMTGDPFDGKQAAAMALVTYAVPGGGPVPKEPAGPPLVVLPT